MEAGAARVLTAFRDMLASESEQVENFSLDPGGLDLVRPTGRVRLSIPEAQLHALLAGSPLDPGQGISAEENAAALMRIHLDESLATRDAHESGWWTYLDGFFHPVPPWEAREHRRHGR